MSTTEYDKNSDNFQVSPSLVLGHLYSAYQEELYLHAVSSPSEYSKVRASVLKQVKIKVVSDLYKNLRDVLCKGELGGAALVNLGGEALVVNYPPNSADSRILSIAKALDKELDEIIDIVIPPFSSVLHNRLEARAT